MMLSMVKVACDQTQQGSLLSHSRGEEDERSWEQGSLNSTHDPVLL